MALVFNFRCMPIRWLFVCVVSLSVTITTFLIFMAPNLDMIADRVGMVEIEGEVYHSARVFRMDYAEMERKFKVFVYPDDKDEYTRYTGYHSLNGKYASEGYFFKNLRESTFLTRDPDKAQLFFIPISCHKMHQKVSSYDKMASIVGKYVEGLIHKYPYWNRTLGADHFFLTCHDIDVKATEAVPLMVKNSIRVVCSASYDAGFIPHKDVSLPLVMQPFAKSAGGNDIAERTILGYWAGSTNSEVRKMLEDLWWGDRELDIQSNIVYKAGKLKLSRAKFCICPAGKRLTTTLITIALHYGCVPVILADHFELPFNDVLDWQKFSVVIKERDVYKLKDILKAKEGAEFRRLHVNLVKVQRHFYWNSPPVKYDAFHMVLYDLWLRRNVVKY